MGFERTYQHSWNQAPADNTTNARLSASQLFFWKQLLLGLVPLTDVNNASVGSPAGVWTVAGSSDGVTAGMDGVDRWTTSFVFAKYVRATAGTPHSWIVLQSPGSFGTGCYLILDYSSATGVNYVNVTVCKTAPTGGTTSARPTTTDAVTFSDQQMNDGTTLPFVFSGVLSTVGDHFFFAQKTASSQAQFLFFLPSLAQTKAGDVTGGIAMYAEYSSSGGGVPSVGQFFSTNWKMRYPDNSGADGTAAASTGPFQPYNGSLGAWATSFNAAGDGVDGTIPDWPVLFSGMTAAARQTVRGRLVDVKVAGADGTNVSNGKTAPASGSPTVQSVVLGCLWWPCNTVPTL